MVCSHSFVGVAPGEAPKAEATELAPEAVGAGPPDSDYNPGSLNRSPRRAFLDDNASGGTSEPRLWAIHAKIGPRYSFWINLHSGGLGRSKNPCIQELLPPALWCLRTGLGVVEWNATVGAAHSAMARYRS